MRRKFPRLRKVIMLLGDWILIVLAGYVSFWVVLDNLVFHAAITDFYQLLPLTIVSAGFLFNVNGLLSVARKSFYQIFTSLIIAIIELFVVLMAGSFFFRIFSYPRSVFLAAVVLQILFLTGWKYLWWRVEQAVSKPQKVLIIGNEQECARIISRINVQPNLNYHIKYTYKEFDNYLLSDENMKDVDLIITAPNIKSADKTKILHFCHRQGKQAFLLPETYELFCYGIELDKIDDIPVFRMKYLVPSLENRILKRCLDLSLTGFAVVLLWPLFIAIPIGIKFTSPGSVFYKQIRTGLNGKEFCIYKFRSMVENAEQLTGPVLAAEHDDRITGIGKILRATRLDELPQLINVLKGDMSIVGPRPERPVFVEQFKKEIPGYEYRHNVRPGITGMAQVHGKYNTTPRDKLIYDLIYIQQCSVVTDIMLMMKTVRVLVNKASTEGVKSRKSVAELTKYQAEH